MSLAKQASKRKRRMKAGPVLGAAGLSLSLVSGASAGTGGMAADVPAPNAGARHEVPLGDEEICDVSLATFYVFGKENENTGAIRPRVRLALAGCGCGCQGCGCWTGTYYDGSVFGSNAYPPHHPTKPAYRYAHAPKRKPIPKNP
jgi:hypothetical protein